VPDLKPKSEVPLHTQVGVERITLEHHGDVPLAGNQGGDILLVDEDAPGGGGQQPGDDPQQGALPTAARSEKDEKLPVGDVDADIVQRHGGAEFPGDLIEVDPGHQRLELVFVGTKLTYAGGMNAITPAVDGYAASQ
jgi:hypothetical protein